MKSKYPFKITRKGSLFTITAQHLDEKAGVAHTAQVLVDPGRGRKGELEVDFCTQKVSVSNRLMRVIEVDFNKTPYYD